jgi:hypothetical protein
MLVILKIKKEEFAINAIQVVKAVKIRLLIAQVAQKNIY